VTNHTDKLKLRKQQVAFHFYLKETKGGNLDEFQWKSIPRLFTENCMTFVLAR